MTDTVDREVFAAVDLGGTRTKAALVDRDHGVVARVVEPTPADLAARIGETVASVVGRLVAAAPGMRLVGCGVVVPGLVDEETGIGVLSVNHGWRDLPIRSRVEEAVGVPVVVGHDVRAGLVAEARLGAAVGARDALFLPLGTGIASAAAVGREYSSRTGELVDAQTVAQRVVEGDPVAVAVWQRAVLALARAVHATLTLTGIDLVLVGGGLAQSGETLLAPLRAEIESLRTFQRPARIVTPALADWAGCLGAACLAWEAT